MLERNRRLFIVILWCYCNALKWRILVLFLAPNQAPLSIRLDAPDPGHVRLSWTAPPVSSWGCTDIYYEIAVDEPPGLPSFKVESRGTTYIFENCEPNQVMFSRFADGVV